MADEFRHKNAVSGRITEAEYEAVAQHILNDGVDGELIEWDTATGGFIRSGHTADADAHHSEAIAQGRPKAGATTYLSVPGTWGYVDGTQAFTKDRIYYYPFYIRTPVVIDQISIYVSTAAGAGEKCRIAVYIADTDWQPGVLQIATAEMAIDAVSVVNAGISDTTLQEGNYLFGINFEGNATLRGLLSGVFQVGFQPTLSTTPFIMTMYVGAAYGVLPDPGTAWDTAPTAGSGMNALIFIRIKTP